MEKPKELVGFARPILNAMLMAVSTTGFHKFVRDCLVVDPKDVLVDLNFSSKSSVPIQAFGKTVN